MQMIVEGPEIPGAVLDALEAGRLVFLCGAGISVDNGLPLFGGLVRNVWNRLNPAANEEVFEALTDTSLPAQERIAKASRILGSSAYTDILTAIASGAYDRALERIERHYGRAQVRKKVQEILRLPESPILRSHTALLDLATTRNGQLQLVTTNFDLLFEEARQDLRFCAAPTLLVPKPGKWNALVYLHGRIDEQNDPEGRHLVLTTADFGTGYLTERWASRFVTELFRNFTVVFVGYSLNDPVMRYLIDALAADRRLAEENSSQNEKYPAYEPAREAFAFVGYEESTDLEKVRADWESKNVTPILYKILSGEGGQQDHRLLHDTLHKWGNLWHGGLIARKNLAYDLGRMDPGGLSDADRSQFLWAISDPDVARYIADLGTQVHLDWIEVLQKEGWLRGFSVPDSKTSLLDAGFASRKAPDLDGVSRYLARWMASHIDNPELLRWVISLGPFLHPEFEQVIDPGKANEPALEKIWRVLRTPEVLFPPDTSGSGYTNLCARLKKEAWTPELRQSLLRAMRPVLRLGKPFVFGIPPLALDPDLFQTDQSQADQATEGNGGKVSKSIKVSDITWADCEVVAGDAVRFILAALREREDVTEILSELSLDLTFLLRQALDLLAALDHAGPNYDPSTLDQPSIAEHPQNHHMHGWTWLIELCRDAFDALLHTDRLRAERLADEWRTIPYPVFRRLYLYAMKQWMEAGNDT